MSKSDMEEVEVYFLYQTERAVLVNDDGGEDGVWLPKSQIEWDDDADYSRGEEITLVAPRWLLEREGLI